MSVVDPRVRQLARELLTRAEWEAFQLHYVEQRGRRSVGLALGISPGSVSSRLEGAALKLRRAGCAPTGSGGWAFLEEPRP